MVRSWVAPARELELAEQEALILIRQERGGEMQEEETHHGHDGAVDNQVADRLAEGAADDPLIFARGRSRIPG